MFCCIPGHDCNPLTGSWFPFENGMKATNPLFRSPSWTLSTVLRNLNRFVLVLSEQISYSFSLCIFVSSETRSPNEVKVFSLCEEMNECLLGCVEILKLEIRILLVWNRSVYKSTFPAGISCIFTSWVDLKTMSSIKVLKFEILCGDCLAKLTAWNTSFCGCGIWN